MILQKWSGIIVAEPTEVVGFLESVQPLLRAGHKGKQMVGTEGVLFMQHSFFIDWFRGKSSCRLQRNLKYFVGHMSGKGSRFAKQCSPPGDVSVHIILAVTAGQHWAQGIIGSLKAGFNGTGSSGCAFLTWLSRVCSVAHFFHVLKRQTKKSNRLPSPATQPRLADITSFESSMYNGSGIH